MKKLGYVFLLLMCIVLVGCGNNKKVESIVDNPAAEINSALNLDAVKNGTSLNTSLDTSGVYYDVKIANDAKASLFYQEIDLSEYLNDKFHSVKLNILYFSGNLASNHVQKFIDEMNNETYGLSVSKLGVEFEIEENILFEDLSIQKAVSSPKNFEIKENDKAKLVVVYLPTYCIYNDGNQPVIRSFIMVPVFYAFAYESNAASYYGDIKEFNVTLENGLLPSAKTE